MHALAGKLVLERLLNSWGLTYVSPQLIHNFIYLIYYFKKLSAIMNDITQIINSYQSHCQNLHILLIFLKQKPLTYASDNTIAPQTFPKCVA